MSASSTAASKNFAIESLVRDGLFIVLAGSLFVNVVVCRLSWK